MTSAIQLNQLSKTFGRGRATYQAVKQVSLEVPAGMVYGFLGPNGAGKTTTIRMLMDLIRPTTGTAQIYGRDVREPATLKRVGALIEGPAFYGYLTGYENLEVLARTRQCFEPKRLHALLEQVGLTDAAQKRASQYSLGMKQRLGLAAALLHGPELLILDEPTNGLDPAGMVEMRATIRQLATDEGKTIFLSSHLLNEVEGLCDRVAIIHQGQIVREGTVTELLAAQNQVVLEVTPLATATALLAEKQWGPVTATESTLALPIQREAIPRLIADLVAAGIQIFRVTPERQSLEDYFLAVTQ